MFKLRIRKCLLNEHLELSSCKLAIESRFIPYVHVTVPDFLFDGCVGNLHLHENVENENTL
jgi:hypothetical protein